MQTTLSAILDDRAGAHPERPLYAFYGNDGRCRESYTYSAFVRRSSFVARQLRDLGVLPGDVVLLVYPPGIEIVVGFFACARIGAIPAPSPLPVQSRRHPSWARPAHIARQAGAAHILSTSAVIRRLREEPCGSAGPAGLGPSPDRRASGLDLAAVTASIPGTSPSMFAIAKQTSGQMRCRSTVYRGALCPWGRGHLSRDETE
jgi:hypothetical protein